MYRRLPKSEGNTLGVMFRDKVSQQDIAAMQKDLEEIIAQHGHARVLVRYDNLDKVDPGAVLQDLKMLGTYIRDLERVAIIGDGQWHERIARWSDLIAEARVFRPNELSLAWEWTQEKTPV
jgi:hypothetical protein